jgi:hypothetical protein
MDRRLLVYPGAERRHPRPVGTGCRADDTVLVGSWHLMREWPDQAAGLQIVSDQHVGRQTGKKFSSISNAERNPG